MDPPAQQGRDPSSRQYLLTGRAEEEGGLVLRDVEKNEMEA